MVQPSSLSVKWTFGQLVIGVALLIALLQHISMYTHDLKSREFLALVVLVSNSNSYCYINK